MEEKEKFNKLIELAEEYIKTNAGKYLIVARELKGNNYTCKELIKDKYRPICELNDIKKCNDWKNILLKRFCIGLQNYRHMTNAINYVQYSGNEQYDEDDNKIFVIAKSFLNKESINDSELLKTFEKELQITKNSSWERYSRGLVDAINYINGLKREKFVETLEKINKDNDKSALKSIYKDIHYMGEALAYDFVKEIGCRNVIKPDTHIKDIARELLDITHNITQTIIDLCKDNKNVIDAYYADKILWLCCSGNFYEDGITINSMNKKNFIKYVKES